MRAQAIETILRTVAVLGNATIWIGVGLFSADARAASEELISQHAAIPIDYESIGVSLPVFISGIFITAGSTWVIAKWDSKRASKLDRVLARIERLEREKSGGRQGAEDSADGERGDED